MKWSTPAEQLFHTFIFLCCAVFVVLRAIHVPMIHDEAATFFIYTRTGQFLPWVAHWDAGNHVLMSALSVPAYHLFGPAPWALRWFAVASYGLYGWYAWRWGSLLRSAP